jgi:hypothetical protein
VNCRWFQWWNTVSIDEYLGEKSGEFWILITTGSMMAKLSFFAQPKIRVYSITCIIGNPLSGFSLFVSVVVIFSVVTLAYSFSIFDGCRCMCLSSLWSSSEALLVLVIRCQRCYNCLYLHQLRTVAGRWRCWSFTMTSPPVFIKFHDH